MLDNFDVAVLCQVNELAARHGVPPHCFSASAGYRNGVYTVDFDTPDESAMSQFDAMLRALGIDPEGDAADLAGTEQFVWDKLADALRKAPRQRQR